MIDKSKVAAIVEEYFQDTDKFLVEIKISRTNKVQVAIDGDNGINISDCARLSRHIESFFDRDSEDFELEVSSVGVGSPLVMLRQYRNNIGRSLSLMLADNRKVKGKLLEVTPEGVSIERDAPKSGKKKKEGDDDPKVFIPFADITLAKVQPSFK
jgi:ribosome maturation factor RimP